MNLLETILNAQDGGLVSQLAKNTGASESDITNVLGKLVPAVSRGIQNNTSNESSMGDLLNALDKGQDKHQRYIDDVSALGEQSTTDDGNAILGHIFGNNKDISRNVAGHAAKETGMDFSLVKKLLPVVAAVAMGALGKKGLGAGLLGAAATSMLTGSTSKSSSSGAMGIVASFLDADKDGHIYDDVFRIAKKFF